MNLLNDLGIMLDFVNQNTSIWKRMGNKVILYFKSCNRITAYIRKTVITGMVIATFQQNTIRILIPNFKIYGYRCDGICEDFLEVGIKTESFHKVE